MARNELVIPGWGDVGPRKPPEPCRELVQPVLADADIRFAPMERVYSDRGSRQLHSVGAAL